MTTGPRKPSSSTSNRTRSRSNRCRTIEPGALRNQSSSVLLPPAQTQQVMIIGGGPVDDVTSATGSTEIVALDQAANGFRPSMPLSLPRMHLNAVLLPDRTVFVSGGAINHEQADVAPIARLQSEIYDPQTDTWISGAVASVIRMYHSLPCCSPTVAWSPPAATRLPYRAARRMGAAQPNEEMRIEVYSPPYLFAALGPPSPAPTTGTTAPPSPSTLPTRATSSGPTSFEVV